MTLSVHVPYEFPIIWFFDETGTDRIIENVMPFLNGGFRRTQSVIEKSTLPRDASRPCDPSFPIADGGTHPRLFLKTHDRMDMIRHRDEQRTDPNPAFLTVADRFKHVVPNRRNRELVGSPFLAADGDKESRMDVTIENPRGHLMLQVAPTGQIIHPQIRSRKHAKMVGSFCQNDPLRAEHHPETMSHPFAALMRSFSPPSPCKHTLRRSFWQNDPTDTLAR